MKIKYLFKSKDEDVSTVEKCIREICEQKLKKLDEIERSIAYCDDSLKSYTDMKSKYCEERLNIQSELADLHDFLSQIKRNGGRDGNGQGTEGISEIQVR